MIFTSNEELPQSVRAYLPPHAQDTYRLIANQLVDRWGVPDVGSAHRLAWAAIKQLYERRDGTWLPRCRA
jgi:cation transport regulator